jgi:hypothetical protein
MACSYSGTAFFAGVAALRHLAFSSPGAEFESLVVFSPGALCSTYFVACLNQTSRRGRRQVAPLSLCSDIMDPQRQ